MNAINKEIGMRIAESRKKRGLSAVELARRTGFSSARISHWEQGRRLPNLDSILVLERELNVPAAYLLCVDLEPSISPASENAVPVYKLSEITTSAPLYKLALPLSSLSNNQALFAVQLQDDSMGSLFRKGDLVVFDRHKDCFEGALVLVLVIKTGQVLFRKWVTDLTQLDNPTHKFIPLNQEFETFHTSNPDFFTILGIYNNKERIFL